MYYTSTSFNTFVDNRTNISQENQKFNFWYSDDIISAYEML